MKATLITVFVCAFSHLIWISVTSAQEEACPYTEHEAATEDWKLKCCSLSTCAFYNCTSELQVCVNSSATPAEACKAETGVDNVCTAIGCSDYNATQNFCCQRGDCNFIICKNDTGDNNITVCVSKSAAKDTLCPEGSTKLTANDTECVAPTPVTTTLAPTTQAPDPTTMAPVVDACNASSGDEKACCANNMCAFFICYNETTSTETGKVCINETDSDKPCPEGIMATNNSCAMSISSTVAPATTTTSGSTQSPTQSPSTGGSSGQQFDASSFIGGIVLAVGLMAIAFFGLKFYRSRTDTNYQSM